MSELNLNFLRRQTRPDPIYRELQSIFESVFGKNIPSVAESMTAKDIKRWDSLTHLNLILAIEEHFGLRFKASDIRGFRTVGDVAAMLKARAGEGGEP